MKTIEPFYFGPSAKPLFGCYHAPQSAPGRDCGVVLCYPMGHEYIASHRAYRQLAVRLSQAGFYVLRFDFFGCGDSGGDRNEGSIHQWLMDIGTAIGAMKERCDVAKVCLVGFRLGGTLAMTAAAEQGGVAGMVLWDPVINGKIYMNELTGLHQEMLRHSFAKWKRWIPGEKPAEILGFPLTDFMLADLENLDLFLIHRKPANNMLLIETNGEVDGGRFKKHLDKMDVHLEYQHFATPKIWMDDINKVLVPNQILQYVVSWMSITCT